MAETENSTLTAPTQHRKPRITIRMGQSTMSFALSEGPKNSQIDYEEYDINGSISQAANLREAFKNSRLLAHPATDRAQAIVDTPVMIVPVEEFSTNQAPVLYRHTFSSSLEGTQIVWSVIPQLNAVAVFTVNKDLRTVVEDHFDDVKWSHVCIPVWTHLYRRSFTGQRRKVYAYFHERRMDLLSFQQNRFRFANSYDASHKADAVYFVLNVWKQLGFSQHEDELYMVGDIPDRDLLQDELHQYVRNVYVINPSADFNRSAASKTPGMPYDLMAMYPTV